MPNLKKHVVFVGNPGAGKSTLLNCLMTSEAGRDLSPKERFRSGVSFGSGLTYDLDEREVNGVKYMDTPGLSDTKKRKAASKAITEALRKDGEYQIVFVVTLESGRIRPDDVTTINLVLQSAPEIKYYGVIINKLKRSVKKKLEDGDPKVLLSEIAHGEGAKPIPILLLIEKHDELDDEEDKVCNVPQVKQFLDNVLLPLRIHSDKVDEISSEKYDEMKEMFERMITELREDNAALREKMEQDRKDFERQLAEIRKEKPNFLSNLIGKIPVIGEIAQVVDKALGLFK